MDSMEDSSFLALIALANKCYIQQNRNSCSQVSFKTTVVNNGTPVLELLYDVILVI